MLGRNFAAALSQRCVLTGRGGENKCTVFPEYHDVTRGRGAIACMRVHVRVLAVSDDHGDCLCTSRSVAPTQSTTDKNRDLGKAKRGVNDKPRLWWRAAGVVP